MESFIKRLTAKVKELFYSGDPTIDPKHFLFSVLILLLWFAIMVAIVYYSFHPHLSYADGGTRLPGEDASEKLEAAGILLKTLDTGIFKWGARIFAGLCIMSSAWALKEQRFGIAIICIIGAILFGTATRWVRNIFDIGDNQSLFSKIEYNLDPKIGDPTFRSSRAEMSQRDGGISYV